MARSTYSYAKDTSMFSCYSYSLENLKIGDLIFFKSYNIFSSKLNSAITSSYSSSNNFYHVAVITKINSSNFELVEASTKYGVRLKEYNSLCSINNFLGIPLNDIEISRLNIPIEQIVQALNIAINFVGSDYNDIYATNYINSKGKVSFYCSQLIQHIFNNATQNNIFEYVSMNFKDSSGKILEYWQNYYSERSITIPQGEPGTHPESIFNSDYLMCI